MNGPGSEGAAPEAPTREGRAAGGLQLGGFTKYIALAALIGVLGGLAAAAVSTRRVDARGAMRDARMGVGVA